MEGKYFLPFLLCEILFALPAVGGGTAGCVLAARLSEIADWKILLVEAGGEQPSKVNIPWFHLWLTDSPLDWKYVTEPQTNALWAFEQQVAFTCGSSILLHLHLQSYDDEMRLAHLHRMMHYLHKNLILFCSGIPMNSSSQKVS